MLKSIKKVGVPFLVIIVSIIVMIVLISMKKEPEKEEVLTKDFLVDAQDVQFGEVQFFVYSQGTVQPKNKTMLSSQVSGRVISIADNFIEGGFFNKGDVLVTLEDDDYQTDLLLAEAEIARAQASLDEELARGRVAEQEWRSVNKGEAPALGLRKPQLAREKANLKAAQAGLQRAKRNLARTLIKAPYDGLVRSRNVDLGQFLPLGGQVGEVFSTEVAQVRLPLTDDDVAFLDSVKAKQADVIIKADIAGEDIRWLGKLVRDEAVLDDQSRVIYGVVEIADPYKRNLDSKQSTDNVSLSAAPLRFGRFVSAEVTGISLGDIVTLPRTVLRLDNTVLTVDEDMKVRINDVDVIKADERFIYIKSGLPENQKVIMSAVPNPYEGMPVRFVEDNRLPVAGDEDSAITEVN